MSPVSTVEDFEVEHKGSDSKLGKVEAEESYDIIQHHYLLYQSRDFYETDAIKPTVLK